MKYEKMKGGQMGLKPATVLNHQRMKNERLLVVDFFRVTRPRRGIVSDALMKHFRLRDHEKVTDRT